MTPALALAASFASFARQTTAAAYTIPTIASITLHHSKHHLLSRFALWYWPRHFPPCLQNITPSQLHRRQARTTSLGPPSVVSWIHLPWCHVRLVASLLICVPSSPFCCRRSIIPSYACIEHHLRMIKRVLTRPSPTTVNFRNITVFFNTLDAGTPSPRHHTRYHSPPRDCRSFLPRDSDFPRLRLSRISTRSLESLSAAPDCAFVQTWPPEPHHPARSSSAVPRLSKPAHTRKQVVLASHVAIFSSWNATVSLENRASSPPLPGSCTSPVR